MSRLTCLVAISVNGVTCSLPCSGAAGLRRIFSMLYVSPQEASASIKGIAHAARTALPRKQYPLCIAVLLARDEVLVSMQFLCICVTVGAGRADEAGTRGSAQRLAV